MSESDLPAKAQRAAEWFNATQDKTRGTYETAELESDGWSVYTFYRYGKTAHDNSCRYDGMSDRMLIAFCEDRGWQDQDQEAGWDADLEAEFQAFKQSPGYDEFKRLTEEAVKYLPLLEREQTPGELQKYIRWILTPTEELCIPTEEEALDLCARGMAQTMDEIDPDAVQIEEGSRYGISHIGAVVEWYATEEYAACNECELAVILTGDGFRWKAIPVEESNRRMVSGAAPTREEARRQAVEAARGLG